MSSWRMMLSADGNNSEYEQDSSSQYHIFKSSVTEPELISINISINFIATSLQSIFDKFFQMKKYNDSVFSGSPTSMATSNKFSRNPKKRDFCEISPSSESVQVIDACENFGQKTKKACTARQSRNHDEFLGKNEEVNSLINTLVEG